MNFPTKEVQTKPFRSRCKKVMCSRRSPTELYGGSIKNLFFLFDVWVFKTCTGCMLMFRVIFEGSIGSTKLKDV